MSKSKAYIKLQIYSPLISDTLPYEVPMKFSNRLLFEKLQSLYDKYIKEELKKKSRGNETEIMSGLNFFIEKYIPRDMLNHIKYIKKNKKDYMICIPYLFKINKDTQNKRKISLIHPLSQIHVCDFYQKYEQLILYYCNLSNYSLRHPYKKTNYVHNKYSKIVNKITMSESSKDVQTKDLQEEIDNEMFKLKPEDFLTNYFIYKKYNLLYKFYTSTELLDLEKKYNYLLKVDVSKCFDSIYSHSISWAIMGKDYAKEHQDFSSFGETFDSLMQSSNYNETNGIPIGSETSRIFAEIILQRIDKNIEKNLIKDYNISIRRYVDDYYIFFNDLAYSKKLEDIVKNELEKYNLHINEKKTQLMTRPFVTIETFVKNKILDILKTFHDSSLDYILKNEEKKEATLISSYQVIKTIRDGLFYKLDPTSISGLILSNLQKLLIKIYSLENDTLEILHLKRLLLEILKISFYIINLSAKCESTYKLVKIIYIASQLALKLDENVSREIEDFIYSEILSIFEKYEKIGLPIEFLDLLTLLNKVISSEEYSISSQRIIKIFKLDSDDILRYFEIVILLDFIQNKKIYSDVKSILYEKICRKLQQSHDFRKAEDFITFFDLIKCPYIDDIAKQKILNLYNIDKTKANRIINDIQAKEWFYNWNNTFDIDEILKIKELNFNSY